MRLLSALGIVLLTMSALLVWFRGPISGGANPSVNFGWLAAGVGLIAGVAWIRRSDKGLALSSLAGLSLCSLSVLYLTLLDPALWDLVDENTQAANIITFSLRYVPGNFGVEPTFKATLPTESLMDRLRTSLYFTDWGWKLCLGGGLSLLINGVALIRGRQALHWIVLPCILILSGQTLFLSRGLVAEYLRMKGDRALALGQYAQAIQRFEDAQQWSRQLARSEQAHLRLGEAYYYLEKPSHPNARFYVGYRYAEQRNVKAAIGIYVLAMQEAPSPLREIIERRLAWTYVNRGMAFFRREGSGPAIGEWERALAYDSSQVQTAYFLSKAYFDEGRYEQSIAVSHLLLAQSRNRLLNANVQANIGDGYWQLKDYDKARLAYRASMRLDSHGNFRGYRSLGGT